ncbi:SDR family NAD(P)-dependent oxidoreductase [Amycolatopsis sp. MEPSY49]
MVDALLAEGDAADLDDLDRLFDTVEREKGAIDVLWASAGTGEQRRLGEITEGHFDAAFGLNARGTLFTVQKALPLFDDGGSIFMTGSNASLKGYPEWSVYAASKAVQQAYARVWLSELKDRRIGRTCRPPVRSPLLPRCHRTFRLSRGTTKEEDSRDPGRLPDHQGRHPARRGRRADRTRHGLEHRPRQRRCAGRHLDPVRRHHFARALLDSCAVRP